MAENDVSVSQAAAIVSEAATEAIVTEAIAESEIEAAQERADHAERVAQEIVDAALHTELGRQVTQLREDYANWQTTQETRIAEQLATFSAQLETLTSQMMDLLSRPNVALVATEQTDLSSSNQAPLEAPALEVATVLPASVVEAAPVVAAPEPAKRPARRLI